MFIAIQRCYNFDFKQFAHLFLLIQLSARGLLLFTKIIKFLFILPFNFLRNEKWIRKKKMIKGKS